MNHRFACRKDAEGKPACAQWCGRQDLCLSTLTYPEDYMQSAWEHGRRDGLEEAAKKCEELGNGTSPQRRVAGEDMTYAIRKLKSTAGVKTMTSDLSDSIDRALAAGLAEASALKLRYKLAIPREDQPE